MYDIQLKRIYAEISPDDGARVLVDRLWPRGKPREALELTDWYRDASPSPALRRLWHQKQITDREFAFRYSRELDRNRSCLVPLMRWCRQGRLTLLSASRELDRSHLPVLRDMLLEALAEEDSDADGGLASPPCYAGQFVSGGYR
ncbi:DUF488 domain-containing protein [Modicisalibacter xianhensis]|uniref:Uncharacterized conserved protein YeaO, DUF488 family n=1 Tax=Modicisalibacter xianhensis TaxID=442341 RepID=A0A1I3CQ15_9GAMM|nr:DUF488 family protein [Halomonas xianhensis]SFH76587.1 Uncharacterized conserved protein YeaO, DUF488 family [Halomonas xianhensis]